ncbi:MAG: hypothetical protein OEY64_03465 [Nitrospinota bacterium]|nr:hypothetical protein [Nitrospinota bacterium]
MKSIFSDIFKFISVTGIVALVLFSCGSEYEDKTYTATSTNTSTNTTTDTGGY